MRYFNALSISLLAVSLSLLPVRAVGIETRPEASAQPMVPVVVDASPAPVGPSSGPPSDASNPLSGSVTGIVAETIKRSMVSTADAVGRIGGAVAGSARRTVTGTVSVAGRMGGALADTVMSTATGTVRVAGNVTHAALDTAGDTVNSAVRLADAVGIIVAGTMAEAARSLITIPKSMLEYATSLVGTPYRWGGTSVSTGMDCSGFVQQVVKASTGKELPRTAREMSQEGHQIDKKELQPGDLVFFNTRRRPFSHVGIYLGDGEFVHGASGRKSGKQVRIDKLSNAYYTKRYNGARRVADIVGNSGPPGDSAHEIN